MRLHQPRRVRADCAKECSGGGKPRASEAKGATGMPEGGARAARARGMGDALRTTAKQVAESAAEASSVPI
eukprot:scaffold228751_cov31-Tisochrysis_lutea.AAC.1